LESEKPIGLRGLAKTGIASTLYWTRADRLIGALAAARKLPLVVGYHRVVEDSAAIAGDAMPGMLITRATFERHLDWIGRRFRILSLDELGCRLESGDMGRQPVAAITFDDGYDDVYHHAFPALQRKGIPAAVFVVTDLTGTLNLQVHDRLYSVIRAALFASPSVRPSLAHLLRQDGISPNGLALNNGASDPLRIMEKLLAALPQDRLRRLMAALEGAIGTPERTPDGPYSLSWDMLWEMHRAGMTIGSHTRTHSVLPMESQEKVWDEVAGSRRDLEDKLGIRIQHFAYPGGKFNATVVNAVATSGYRFAYTVCQHGDPSHPMLTIPRTFFWENSSLDVFGRFSPAILSCQANGVFNLLTHCRQDHTS
jgi:peptidoglycan/xylan/chitin deacetylase (PgdA/CDA1 family)